MNNEKYNASLFSFINNSPTPFHCVDYLRKNFISQGFLELHENERWNLKRGIRYFVIRNGAIVVFFLSPLQSSTAGFRIIGAHTDSPSLKIKPHPLRNGLHYGMMGVETYGGAILHSWVDRGLSLAGRVSIETSSGKLMSLLIDFARPVVYIPSLAIHLNRKVNDSLEINAQKDLCPIFCQKTGDKGFSLEISLIQQVQEQYPKIEVQAIHGFDLFCYIPTAPLLFGQNNEFISAPRLDNLLSCHIGIEAMHQADLQANSMLVYNNHEEVGSTSLSGALGNFTETVLARIIPEAEERAVCLSNSFLLSLDNAHATHPSFPDKSDGDHHVFLNTGPVVKINAGQRYSSSADTAALFRIVAKEAGVQTQDFVMRSDMPCGSTIGPLASAKLGVATVDVGAATWAMHAAREVTGHSDPLMLFQATRHFLDRKNLPYFSE